jgi:hypothetical protein
MEYVEFLRDRRILRNYAIVLFAGFALAIGSLLAGTHGTIEVHSTGHPGTIDASAFAAICAFLTFVTAAILAPGLSAQGTTLAIAWTRPVERRTVAWRFIAVDLAALVVAYLMLLATCGLFYAVFHTLMTVRIAGSGATDSLDQMLVLRFDGARALGIVVRGFGCAVMWYGLVTLVSARFPQRGAMIAGLSWVAFLVLATLTAVQFPPLIHLLIVALNYLNPLAYFGNVSTHGTQQIIPWTGASRTLASWCIGIAALIGTVRLWSTQEV